MKRLRLLNAAWLGLCLATALLGTTARAADPLPPLPPLVEQAGDARLPGKFVWADLFSSDLDASRDFLAGLFGWEWHWISDDGGRRYGIFYHAGSPVAGLVEHRRADAPDAAYGRWVHFISVADVDDLVTRARARGAEVLLPAREVAERGRFAILADNEQAPVGVLASSSGDPADYRAEPGEWLWHQRFSREAATTATFYRDLFGYALHTPEMYPDLVDTILASDGFARAGITPLDTDGEARPQWLGLVRVDDLDAVLSRVASLGGSILVPPDPGIAGGAVAVVLDPVGAPLGLARWDDADGEGAR